MTSLSISDGSPDEVEEIYDLMVALDSATNLLGQYDPQTLAVANRLAVAFWRFGDAARAIGLLDQALDRPFALESEHPIQIELLRTMGKIMFAQRYFEQAGAIHREILELQLLHSGAQDPNTIETKGDLAAILFELGSHADAERLEHEAFEDARAHLGKSHSLTCVLAWNRAVSYERCGDFDSAKRILVDELVWLLAEDFSCLDADQNTIRGLLSKRLNWDTATSC